MGLRKQDFDRDGYVVVRELMPRHEFERLRFELERYIGEVVPGLPDSEAFYVDRAKPESLKQMQRLEADDYFAELSRHAAWVGLAAELLGEEVEPPSIEWFNKPPGSPSPTPPHQDNYYFNLNPPHVATIWLALDDLDEENGCLRYVAGSHLLELRPHGRSDVLGFSQGISDYGAEDEEAERAVSLESGDAVVHHGNTIHRADPNRSDRRERRALAMVFRGVSARRDEEAFARYLSALKAQQREMGLEV